MKIKIIGKNYVTGILLNKIFEVELFHDIPSLVFKELDLPDTFLNLFY